MRDCPVCSGKLRKIHRRRIDRILSVFYPVERFSCRNDSCGWEGNVRIPTEPQNAKRIHRNVLIAIVWVLVVFGCVVGIPWLFNKGMYPF